MYYVVWRHGISTGYLLAGPLLDWPEDRPVGADGPDHVAGGGERHGPLQPARHLRQQRHQGVGAAALVVQLAQAQETVILTTQSRVIQYYVTIYRA